ncbi:hypothetical protein ACP_1708 [Acidobacterium capsulatum ATCC 51196]|uniref:Uncharacterized protein n=1 Tax=Acidobacterium capsulatum (strain ATCC 51196 / DSM 11244 / BCRC 80197 / JCM 7670 / NBRC 15755 / NCIMB 13165 / 161) TaxID=240015 RepID=C1F7F2_ACIC5|nr:hypothetical protein ACP_1708 [Acidobacterium capsulatum ATCC 51196]
MRRGLAKSYREDAKNAKEAAREDPFHPDFGLRWARRL